MATLLKSQTVLMFPRFKEKVSFVACNFFLSLAMGGKSRSAGCLRTSFLWVSTLALHA